MTPLHELQMHFAAAVFDETDTEFAAQIHANGLSGARRLRVYRNNIFTNLTEALRAVYPVIEKLIGAEFFAHLSERYIRAHPSRDGNLHAFGQEFAEYVQAFTGLNELPYLGDVARLEWSYHETFHAAAHPPLDLARFSAIDPERYGELKFTMHPACRLVTSLFPILKIWQLNQPDDAGADEVNLDSGGDRLLVIRRALDVEVEPLSLGAFALLHSLHTGNTFAQASDAAFAVDTACDVANIFQHFVLSEVLVDFTL